MTKACRVCGVVLEVGKTWSKSNVKIQSNICVRCEREWQRKYYLRNREKLIEKQRKYYQENRERCLEWHKDYKQTERGKEIHRRASRKYEETENGKTTKKRYFQSKKGRETSKRAGKKYRQTDKYKEFKANYHRDLGHLPIWFNPFEKDDITCHGHHINDLLVVDFPEDIHRSCLTGTDVEKHRQLCDIQFEQLYGFNFTNLFKECLKREG